MINAAWSVGLGQFFIAGNRAATSASLIKMRFFRVAREFQAFIGLILDFLYLSTKNCRHATRSFIIHLLRKFLAEPKEAGVST